MIRIKGHLHTGPDGLGAINGFVMNLADLVNDLGAGYMIGTPHYMRNVDGYQAEWTLFVPDQKADKAIRDIGLIVPRNECTAFVNKTKKFTYGHDATRHQ